MTFTSSRTSGLTAAVCAMATVGCWGPESTPDTEAPSAPENVRAVVGSGERVGVSWEAATDNVGVAGYHIYRDGVHVAEVSGTAYSDPGPDSATDYRYTVAAYDSAGNVSGESSSAGVTTVAAKPDRGALATGTDPRWLFYDDGTPFFMVGAGGPEWFLYDGAKQSDGTRSGGRQQAIIDAAIANGWNAIYMIVDATGDTPGAHPWLDYDDPGGSDRWDPDIVGQWHEWFRQMDDAGITIFVFLYDDSVDPFGAHNEAERAFIDDLIGELRGYDHLIWVVAEEYSESIPASRARQIAARIRAADPVHPIANHQLTGAVFDFAGDATFDAFAAQLDNGTDPAIDPVGTHQAVVDAWRNAAGRYVVIGSELQPDHGYPGREALTRQTTWGAVLGGAYVTVLRWWDDVRSDGNPSPSTTEQRQAGYARRFVSSTRFDLMEPDDSRAAGDTEWVLAHRTDLGNDYFIGYGRNVTSGIGFTGLDAGTYDLTWLDTETGDTLTEQQAVPTPGIFTFGKPTAITGHEVALYARKGDG